MWSNTRAVFSAVLSIPLGGILSVLLKYLFNAPRPSQWSGATDITILGPVLTGNSFPSGHTITAFAAAFAIIMTIEYKNKIKQRFITLSIFIFASFIGLSRVMVGAHWPYDVVAGACVGWIGGVSGLILAGQLEIFWQKVIIQQITLILLWLVSFYNLFREFEYSQGVATVWISFSLSTLGVLVFFWSLKKKN
jgi:membrane-associated phospholipid phosphatase